MTEHRSAESRASHDEWSDTPEQRYADAPCGLLTTTPDGILTEVNDTFLRWTGYSRTSVIGTPFEQLLTVGSHVFYETRYLPVLRLAGEVRELSLTLRCAGGGTLPVLVNATTHLGPDGRPRLVRTAIFDSTQRHSLERELLVARRVAEASEARVRVLQDAGAAFGACDSEESVAAALVDCARQAFRATAAAVVLIEESGDMRLAAGDHPLLEALAGTVVRRPEADALSNGRAVTITSLQDATSRFPDVADALRATRLEALSVIPLIGGERSVGLLLCFYGRQRGFDDDVLALQAALALQAVQVFERVRLHAELENLALYDPLTGLANRKLLQHTLGAALVSAERKHTPMAVVFLDLDGFKAVNDGLGHLAGDAVLEQVADRLRAVVRGSDTVARFGGDEFVVVCEDINERDARQLADRIRLAVRRPLPGVAGSFAVTASVGIALHRPAAGAATTVADLLQAADSSMYVSKSAGKDGITVVTV
ncbi:diguanylate cyclase [Cryobacterium melibiosiphilum]|uniref:Diguanylate cyclase n=1 Tax=Cryobacterium melibiosiphilum TaxID=995039 RepID=A0A3A5MMW8_9MICO|nr:diguanylate cyclase [Cryobacterium melibiosiphilum]RJT87376.1 diguanylate cyclase [Cryobacterium melibiosiphilum]